MHRDIKPSNVYLCEFGGIYDFVKVLDFGLVKTEQSEDAARVTGKDAIIGTAAFMPPEQAAGGEVDARSDLYALGCVGYWLLTRRLPFEGTMIEVLLGHASEAPPPISTRSPSPVPADLENLLMRCLAKRREDRPESAGALHEELTACQAGAAWTQAQAKCWWDEHAARQPT